MGSVAASPIASQASRTSAVRQCSSMPISFTRVSQSLVPPFARSPRYGLAVSVNKAQSRRALLRDKRVDQLRNSLLDAERRIRAPSSVRIQPGAISTIARGSAAWRAA